MEQMHWNILDLANQLRQERLFVNSEQQQLQNLNEKVLCASSKLAQLAWVTAQQRENLNRLIVARPDCTPAACCQKATAIEATDFVDAYKVLGFQESLAYGELLSNLCMAPQLLASCLVVGDRILPPDCMTKVAHSVYTGLLGSSLLPDDKLLALKLLRHLTELQLVPSDNPRRLLRQKSCAFARLYSEFHEGLFSAKLFLTAALHKPIMQLLMEDEMFLDIDPDKATVRFPPEERLKRFGTEGTPEHAVQLAEYRKWTIGCLVRVTNRFVSSIRENMHCFPTSVRWLVRQIAGLLTQTGNIEPKEVHAICTDLIFTHFICPAMVNPEPYGITDAPISYIARFNLIQVAQIVQTLAMTRYEEVSSKVADLYSHFEKDCVSSILDIMLDGVGATVNEEPATIEGGKLQGLVRSCALFTEQELQNLIHFLQSVASSEADDTVDKKQLRALLIQLPSSAASTVNGNSSQNTPSPSKLTPPTNDTHKRGGLLGKVSRNRTSSAPASPGRGEASDDGGLDEEVLDRPSQDVLLIPFGSSASENVGFLSEQKVLCGDEGRCQTQEVSLPNGVDVSIVGTNSVERTESQEKRTRFSLLHDEGSIGRGTPNISGRDTPSSQITEGEEGPGGIMRGGAGEVRQQLDFHSTAQNKQSRSDIDDKFGKFEIKKLLEGDETVSMVSDTWSTDVLASDSETIEQSERSFPSGSISENTIQQLSEATQLLDVSETASEAWSTDVLASDSERMTEVDTDDTGSVARSDDTARSEIEVEGRGEPEGGEETPPSQASLNLNSSFRPIREDPVGRAGLVPPSPTRVDIAVQPAWNSAHRGKAEYKRRIAEYVDTEDSPRLIHVIDKMDKPSEQKTPSASVRQSATNVVNVPNPLVLVPNGPVQLIPNGSLPLQSNGPVPSVPNRSTQPAPTAPSNNVPLNSNGLNTSTPGSSAAIPASPPVMASVSAQNTCVQPLQAKLPSDLVASSNDSVDVGVKQEALIEDDVLSRDSTVGESIINTVRLSSASLASSSSSSGSSSDPRPKTATPTPELPLLSSYPVMNGHAVMPEGETRASKAVSVTSSTGAIPKSISFDKTAERGDKDMLDEDSKHKRGFFRNFKFPFKPRRVKSGRSDDSRCYEPMAGEGDLPHRLRRMSEEAHSTRHDTTEDILAKYRRKPSTSSETTASENLTEANPIKAKQQSEDRLNIDPRNIEASDAFADAKRKLRMVLSTADLQHAPWSSESGARFSPKENELVSFLQLQLAEAINLQDHSLISHLHETLRCIRLFDDAGCCKLFQSLHDDYQKRSPYIAYLVRSRKGLLSTLAHFERLTERVKKDHNVCSRFLIAVCVTLFLEKREGLMLQFQEEFQQLTLADEKTDLLDNFLQTLAIEMERDPTWQAASETQLEQARAAIERAVMGRVYIQALYPNGDGDVSRDQVLHDHMKKLSDVITPNHKDLRIPKRYHYECPWPSAQAEIAAISAYKTPRDKLQCVFRCATTIMNLLAMACVGSVPAADDFVPVLVYVLIKANLPSLLSTVQYVDSFYGSRLEGEEQYWWIQFCSAIEFIKTMDYGD
ncbi:Uncharacterized protein GBIM_13724 [Gryllus bimaculatus]|nr:Uncharacterized protein GBIM_13724 [Gryllus bimaculatus]